MASHQKANRVNLRIYHRFGIVTSTLDKVQLLAGTCTVTSITIKVS